jgi:lipoprotein-anchoring transpeptidase ErfK/SrfK
LSFKKVIIIGSFVIFGFIGLVSLFKKPNEAVNPKILQEVVIERKEKPKEKKLLKKEKPKEEIKDKITKEEIKKDENLPDADIIYKLFVCDSSKLPIVETVTYASRVPWLSSRPAWIADYASHYSTTRHFIARSLNKKPDYFTQKISPGDRFNVLKKNIEFFLLIDISRLKLWFYAIDGDTNVRYLLKTYKVGLGRKDSKKESSILTPKGKFSLGSKVAIYKPGVMGYFQDRKIEMMRVFGTRWIPFEKEISGCSDQAKGYGIHGAPWYNDPESDEFKEDRSKVNKYDSDGCIRLYSEDIEEIFSIVISRPTVVELVNDFKEAKLPGEEKNE